MVKETIFVKTVKSECIGDDYDANERRRKGESRRQTSQRPLPAIARIKGVVVLQCVSDLVITVKVIGGTSIRVMFDAIER